MIHMLVRNFFRMTMFIVLISGLYVMSEQDVDCEIDPVITNA